MTGALPVFWIGHRRGGADGEALLGTEFAGTIRSDSWWFADNRLVAERRALRYARRKPGLLRPVGPGTGGGA